MLYQKMRFVFTWFVLYYGMGLLCKTSKSKLYYQLIFPPFFFSQLTIMATDNRVPAGQSTLTCTVSVIRDQIPTVSGPTVANLDESDKSGKNVTCVTGFDSDLRVSTLYLMTCIRNATCYYSSVVLYTALLLSYLCLQNHLCAQTPEFLY